MPWKELRCTRAVVAGGARRARGGDAEAVGAHHARAGAGGRGARDARRVRGARVGRVRVAVAAHGAARAHRAARRVAGIADPLASSHRHRGARVRGRRRRVLFALVRMVSFPACKSEEATQPYRAAGGGGADGSAERAYGTRAAVVHRRGPERRAVRPHAAGGAGRHRRRRRRARIGAGRAEGAVAGGREPAARPVGARGAVGAGRR